MGIRSAHSSWYIFSLLYNTKHSLHIKLRPMSMRRAWLNRVLLVVDCHTYIT